MSCTYRVIVLILLMLLSACATCAVLFPIYRKEIEAADGAEAKLTYYYWYRQTSRSHGDNVTIERIYSYDYSCSEERDYFIASSALSVAGAGLGGLACMFIACWVNAGRRPALGAIGFVFTFFAFACCGAVVGLTGFFFSEVKCDSADSSKGSVRDQGYNLAEGTILMAAATGGFLILLFVQSIGLCCTFCCGSSKYDDLSRDFDRRSSRSDSEDNDGYRRSSSRNP
ncbi:hypothetical protein ABL78_6231 [Leptomonas seymouri]|uniref:Uncharacterized protein n=1 Tax=Leptomonas seymouri TaxID=5684 RepID=A0A0N0P3Z6_LEPSE|nr:hypothetical protein ABL78_6231 [Leptomonas seymouri]|eukprot:KPI84709.1 hypothetical protein ABL78_6231 [Leptomonas seymouri]